jgi:hypothetical protein
MPALAAAIPAENSALRNSARLSIKPFPATTSSGNVTLSFDSGLLMTTPISILVSVQK